MNERILLSEVNFNRYPVPSGAVNTDRDPVNQGTP